MTSRPRGFSGPAEFGAWLAKNHATATELFVRCAKAHVPYRRTCSFWVMSAKQPETRERRLALLVSRLERGEGIPPLKRPAARDAKSRKEA